MGKVVIGGRGTGAATPPHAPFINPDLLVDGIRLNNSTFRDGPNQYWSTVDALAVEQLEVVKGPAAVMYGSDAIGGTVNALMRSLRYGFGEGTLWSGSTYYRYGSAEHAVLGRGEFGAAERDHWGFNLGLTGKLFGDVRGGSEVGRQPHTGYDEYDTDFKAEYYFTPEIPSSPWPLSSRGEGLRLLS
jgi:hemoglobin/transferrin/lactoferrin receptor protein